MTIDISKKVIETIKEKEITPTPKWQFIGKEYGLWFFGAVLIIVGSIAFSVVLFMTINNDWEVYYYINDNIWVHILRTLPYFWIVLLALFFIGAEYHFRHTKRGYKHALPRTMIALLSITVISGTGVYIFGGASAVDTLLVNRAPYYYEKVTGGRHGRWVQPEQGRLSGVVQDVDVETIILQDIRGNVWKVITIDAKIATGTQILPDKFLKIIGAKEESDVFKAYIIVPGGKGPSFQYYSRPKMIPAYSY